MTVNNTPPDEQYRIREFQCLRCGNCCRGEGFVEVGDMEIQRLAEFLGMTNADFRAQYTIPSEEQPDAPEGIIVLIEKPGPQRECIFLQDNGCIVHPAKPDQCVGFPMKWRTRDAFDYCEGLRA